MTNNRPTGPVIPPRRNLPTPLVSRRSVLGAFPQPNPMPVYNSPSAAYTGARSPSTYPYPICIRHYARMDRAGNRVPISGNIISVTRLTASENRCRPPPPPQREIPARLCAPPNVTENIWPGRKGNEGDKKVTDLFPRSFFHLAVFFRGRNRCVILRSTSPYPLPPPPPPRTPLSFKLCTNHVWYDGRYIFMYDSHYAFRIRRSQ